MTVTPCDTPEALSTALTGAGSKLVREVWSPLPAGYLFVSESTETDDEHETPNCKRLLSPPLCMTYRTHTAGIPEMVSMLQTQWGLFWVCGRCVDFVSIGASFSCCCCWSSSSHHGRVVCSCTFVLVFWVEVPFFFVFAHFS
ncbi:unnamed protein product [Ectocarpus sp. 12 AP-2014]